MLDRSHRLTTSAGFTHAVRTGRRAGTRTLVLHLGVLPTPVPGEAVPGEPMGTSARVGFVVSRAVGNAVTRNLVKRRLRHLTRERITSLPVSAVLVVRALPASALASYDGLSADLDKAWGRLAAVDAR
ncbi:MAG: ribonuclease P protein component [Nocardioidaceae bacterium]